MPLNKIGNGQRSITSTENFCRNQTVNLGRGCSQLMYLDAHPKSAQKLYTKTGVMVIAQQSEGQEMALPDLETGDVTNSPYSKTSNPELFMK